MLKKSWLVVLAALLVIGGAEAGVRTFADDLPRPMPWGNLEAELKANRMTQLRNLDVRASVAFVGSSMMDVGIDPAKMDIGSAPDELPFNAALFATDARTMAFYTEHVVVPRLRPRVVVIGVSSFDLNDGGDTQRIAYENIISSPEARRLLGRQGAIERLGAIAAERSTLIRHRSSLRRPSDLTKGRFYAADVKVSPHGVMDAFSAPRPKYTVTGSFKNLARNESYKDFSVGGEQTRSLDRTIAMLRSKGIGVVVLKMPLTMDAVALHPNGAADYELFKRVVREVVRRHKVQYVDVLTAGDGRYGFYDPVHLNLAGSRYFSRAVGMAVTKVLARTPEPPADVLDVEGPVVPASDAEAPDVDAPGPPSAGAPAPDAPPAPPASADEPEPPPIVIPAPGPDTIDRSGL